MLSSRILARFQTGAPEILAAGKILTARNFVSRRKSRQHSHRDIQLPAKNPGKTPTRILPRFWPPRIPSPTKNPGKTPAGVLLRVWPPGSRFPPRFPARFCRDPAEILAARNLAPRQESKQDSRRDPAGNPASRQESR